MTAHADKVAASGLQDARILVVDDLRSSRMMITAILKAAGFTTIESANDGAEALTRIADWNPEIVILDIVMPNVDGFEVCRRVRGELDLSVPILVQTSLSQPEEKVRAFTEGATDIVAKPVDAGELISRVCLHLERERMMDQLRRYQSRMEAELRTAEQMQLALLKSPEDASALTAPYQVSLESFYQASNQLGGDLWDVFTIDDDRLGLLLVDLSGHGVSSAINAFRLHLITRQIREFAAEPANYLAALNDRLTDILPVQQFATVLYGVWNKSDRSFRVASAGAPYPVHLKSGGQASMFEVGGAIAGCQAGLTFEESELALENGDALFFYSDALYENFDDPEQSLDEDALMALAKRAAAEPAGTRTQKIVEWVFPDRSESFRDDLTLLYLEG